LFERLKVMADEQQVSVDQFVASAVAEKMAVMENQGYIARRANRADEKKYREALDKIPDTAPAEYDAI
jgi:hypothetical protein